MFIPSPLRPHAALLLLACLGCTTTATSNTARTAKEQLLISNSVDQALETTDFTPLARRKVFLEEKYLDSVDQKYIVGSIRHHVFRAGAALVDKAEDADVILEVRSGAVGTESNTSFLGMPAISLPGPLPVSLPEVRPGHSPPSLGPPALVSPASRPRLGLPGPGAGLATGPSLRLKKVLGD